MKGCPHIVSRSEWSQRASLCSKTLPPSRKYAVIHHTLGKRCFSMVTCKKQLQNIQHYHMVTRKWCDIGYNFLIGEDGNIYEGRGWTKQGAHTYGYNWNSLGISIMGNFMRDAPNKLALTAAQNLIQCLASKGYLASNYVLKGHRQLGKTKCPGDSLYNIITKWPNWS
ncbi:peptidoglycan recognition protein 5 isoform X2 [Pristis pectinata]|uniref:peptidoglycan recognition protein 5 isoform X2 n=1 Tax=Pristis pectinata TaxID=685728 RepID=UPI00223DEFB6|nr:peptidoglycan recognition protein 5 isoform X2 [Pristis pectinata]